MQRTPTHKTVHSAGNEIEIAKWIKYLKAKKATKVIKEKQQRQNEDFTLCRQQRNYEPRERDREGHKTKQTKYRAKQSKTKTEQVCQAE